MRTLSAALPLILLGAVSLSAQVPQAFVPNKLPLKQPQPHIPDDLRKSASLRPVELLVTIDPLGQVSAAEALTGDPKVRPLAVEAVRQWKFRPVVRLGTAVYAYTQVMMDLQDPLELAASLDAAPPDFDIQEEMASVERFGALRQQFPRTAQQELEDLEQDRGQGIGIERDMALPDLAKAALRAEAYDKAQAYADELMTRGATGANAGQAIHDGHMVLGLIALHKGDVGQAKQELLKSAATSGSPVLMSFGPNVSLAKGLLDKGERDVVLEYFDLCRKFWSMGGARLDEWSKTIRAGRTPEFGANLMY